jgi:hypothetical protein
LFRPVASCGQERGRRNGERIPDEPAAFAENALPGPVRGGVPLRTQWRPGRRKVLRSVSNLQPAGVRLSSVGRGRQRVHRLLEWRPRPRSVSRVPCRPRASPDWWLVAGALPPISAGASPRGPRCGAAAQQRLAEHAYMPAPPLATGRAPGGSAMKPAFRMLSTSGLLGYGFPSARRRRSIETPSE